MNDELDDVEALVRAAKLTTTRDFDERVMGEAAPRMRWPRAARWAAGIVVAVLLGGALTAAAAGWFDRRTKRPGLEPTESSRPPIAAPQTSAPPDPATASRVAESHAAPSDATEPVSPTGNSEPEVEEEAEPTVIGLGESTNVDARATVREVPILARVRISGTTKGGKEHRELLPRGTIEAIYKGDASLIGRGVTIHRRTSYERKSFLSWDQDQEGEKALFSGSGSIVMPLMATNVGIPTTGDVHLRIAIGERFSGTLVRSDLPVRPVSSSDDEIIATLRDDLVASLSATDPAVRRSSIGALRCWSGEFRHDVSELWRDEATAKALLAAGHDDDAKVRWTVACMVTPAAGTAGRELLEDQLFDSDPMVRQVAARLLENQGGSEFLEQIESLRDGKWEEHLSGPSPLASKLARNLSEETLRNLKEHKQAEVRAEIAWALGITAPSPATSAALLAALDDPDFEVRRGAAHSLGRLGGEGVTDRLDGVPNTEDPRVRVVAAWSQVKLGDKRGYAHLSRLVANEDLRAATQACTALGRIPKRDAVALLLNAAADPRPVVRGAAVLSLAQRAKKNDAPHRAAVEALLAGLARDEDDYVRAAARAAQLRRIAKPAAASSQESDGLIARLGYVGYVAGDGDDSDDE